MVVGIGRHIALMSAIATLARMEPRESLTFDIEGRDGLGESVIIVDEAHMSKHEDIYKRPPPSERPTPKKREPKPEIDLATWRGKQGREAARRLRQMQRRADKSNAAQG